MLPRRCLLLKRMFYSLHQPANIINRHTLPSTITISSDFLKRFSSVSPKDHSSSDRKTDHDREYKLKFIELEMTNLRDQGHRVPEFSSVKPQHFEELLKFESTSARKKYYNFLFVREKKIENEKKKKQEKARAWEAFSKQRGKEENPHITYSLANTAILLRIYDKTIDMWRNNRLR